VAIVSRPGSRSDSVVIAAALVIAIILIALPARFRDPLATVVRTTVDAPLLRLQHRAELARSALLSHDSSAAIADSAAIRAMLVPALESENERLRRLLGLSQRLGWGFVPAEALQGRGLGEDYTLALTAGSSEGVRRFSPVVAPAGLVGTVETVDRNMSLVILWTHPDFRASAEAVDGSAFGIIRSHVGSGAERYLLELSGVPFRSSLKPGTLIVSSGLGGTYPRGIPIGTVLSELKTPEAWARTYLVRPVVLPSSVQSVMILLPQRVASGVQRVWVAPPSADSAVRVAGAMGDSAARRLGLAEVEARRAVLDSVRAAGDSVPRRRIRRDTTARRLALDSARRDSARRDSVRRDSARRDSTRPDSTRPDSVSRRR
jgi:rod shape-determining protein MreC